MTSAPAIVLFCSVFEYVHLGALEVLKDICLHNNILQERSATGELPIGFVANNSPQLYLAAWRSHQTVHCVPPSFFDKDLMASNFNNGIFISVSGVCWRSFRKLRYAKRRSSL